MCSVQTICSCQISFNKSEADVFWKNVKAGDAAKEAKKGKTYLWQKGLKLILAHYYLVKANMTSQMSHEELILTIKIFIDSANSLFVF